VHRAGRLPGLLAWGQLAVHVIVGTGLTELEAPMKPRLDDAPGASAPFQASLVAVTAAPDWVAFPPQAWVTVWPLPKVQDTVQPVVDDVPEFVTFTSPWKPPGH
jgi:hypothetical protein